MPHSVWPSACNRLRRRTNMKIGLCGASLMLAIGALVGCSDTMKSPDVADNVHKAITQAGLQNVTVSQDRVKGVVTLNGHVATAADKARADQIAQSQAQGQVVANQIEV